MLNIRKFLEGLGLVPKTTLVSDSKGELEVADSDGKLNYHNGSTRSPVVTESHTATLTNKTIDADGTGNVISNIDNGNIKAAAAIDATKIADGSVDNTEFQFLDGVNDNIQDQLDNFDTDLANHISDTSTHGITSTIVGISETQILTNKTIDADLNTISNIENADIKALAAIDATKIADGSVSNTEFQFLDGVTSSIQTQLNAKVSSSSGSSVDNHLARWDGTGGNVIQDGSTAVLSDAGALSGLTQLTVDNIDINGNVISSTDTNGNVVITPNGTGSLQSTKNAQFDALINFASANDAATGANATLTAPTTKVIRLTSGSLTSVDGIPSGTSCRELIIENVTGNSVIINNDTGATTANRFLTGTGTNLTLADTASIALSYDSTTSRWRVIGGSGSGNSFNINYITAFDGTTTTGWATYADAAQATPVDGTGGSPNVTFATSTSSPLVGSSSFLFTKDAANRQGQGVSYDFTIDSGYQAQILRLTFPYSVSTNYVDTISGNLISSDMQAFIYDKTNAVLIPVIDQNIGASATGLFAGSFQTASNSTSYRLILHVASTNASAYTLKLDNVVVGPQTLVKGPIVTNWVNYGTFTANAEITGFGTMTGNSFPTKWRRVGGNLEMRGFFTAGTVSANIGSVLLPNGYQVDAAKVLATNTTSGNSGIIGRWITNGANTLGNMVTSTGSATNSVYFAGTFNNAGMMAPMTVSTFVPSSAVVSFELSVPIAGWDTNTVLSEDSGNRQIALSYTGNGGQALTAGSTNVTFSTLVYDTTSSWNGTTFTVPETGIYDISGLILLTGAVELAVAAYVNTVLTKTLSEQPAANTSHVFGGTMFLTKGQALTIRVNNNATLSNSATGHHISISKLATPQTIVGSETVAVKAIQTSGQSIPDTTVTTVTYDAAKVYDTHGALNASTGVFTVPVSGWYYVRGMFTTGNAAWTATTHSLQTVIAVNGSTVTRSFFPMQSSVTNSIVTTHADVVYVTKGGTIEVRVSIIRGASTTLSTDGTRNVMTINLIK